MLKDYCPGYYDPASGGVVQAGETYAHNAERELAEEMGVSGVPLEHCFTFLYEDDVTKCWGDAWRCVYDG
jgi:ADP-ribose pyrophosphatase YjhB (NUDIX family)